MPSSTIVIIASRNAATRCPRSEAGAGTAGTVAGRSWDDPGQIGVGGGVVDQAHPVGELVQGEPTRRGVAFELRDDPLAVIVGGA
jgi:hypothetical protein